MTHAALETFLHQNAARLRGPVAVILAEDMVELHSTIRHAQSLGFPDILVIGAVNGMAGEAGLYPLPADLDTIADSVDALNAVIKALPERWISYCFNAEYLYFPYCETRTIADAIAFMEEERRTAVYTYAIDLYPQDLAAHRDGIDPETPHMDASGYYGLEHFEGADIQDRQFDIYGGLRWRFEEHIPWDRRRIDRISLFKAVKGLEIGEDLRLNIPEMNTISCKWHRNMTMAVMSFRVAKALMHNPGSADAIDSFIWGGSRRFEWSSDQLLRLGFMETGQWF